MCVWTHHYKRCLTSMFSHEYFSVSDWYVGMFGSASCKVLFVNLYWQFFCWSLRSSVFVRSVCYNNEHCYFSLFWPTCWWVAHVTGENLYNKAISLTVVTEYTSESILDYKQYYIVSQLFKWNKVNVSFLNIT